MVLWYNTQIYARRVFCIFHFGFDFVCFQRFSSNLFICDPFSWIDAFQIQHIDKCILCAWHARIESILSALTDCFMLHKTMHTNLSNTFFTYGSFKWKILLVFSLFCTIWFQRTKIEFRLTKIEFCQNHNWILVEKSLISTRTENKFYQTNLHK